MCIMIRMANYLHSTVYLTKGNIDMGVLEELKKEITSDSQLQKQYEIEKEIYDIAVCLRKIRKEKKMTQKDIAKKTGLSQQMVSKIESYNGNPSIESFVKYCDGIGINLMKLLSNYQY